MKLSVHSAAEDIQNSGFIVLPPLLNTCLDFYCSEKQGEGGPAYSQWVTMGRQKPGQGSWLAHGKKYWTNGPIEKQTTYSGRNGSNSFQCQGWGVAEVMQCLMKKGGQALPLGQREKTGQNPAEKLVFHIVIETSHHLLMFAVSSQPVFKKEQNIDWS